MEGEPTTSPGNAFIVETGMMLVALRESLADERVADGALRSVIWQGQRKALSLEEQDAQPADIDIDAQRAFADYRQQQPKNGWLGAFGLFAAHMTHEKRHAAGLKDMASWAPHCVEITKQLWQTYSTTRQILNVVDPDQDHVTFGYAMWEEGLDRLKRL